jgi:hypothetical protein
MSRQRLRRYLVLMEKQIDLEFNGLNPEDRKRIATVGYSRWLNEVCDAQLERKRIGKKLGAVSTGG